MKLSNVRERVMKVLREEAQRPAAKPADLIAAVEKLFDEMMQPPGNVARPPSPYNQPSPRFGEPSDRTRYEWAQEDKYDFKKEGG